MAFVPDPEPSSDPLSAHAVVSALENAGVTHLVGLPDNAAAPLFALVSAHPGIELVPVTREGEAFAIASGLWLGGKTPVVSIQNTGLLESGDALRGTAQRMGVPLVILLGYRGFEKMRAAGFESGAWSGRGAPTPASRAPHRMSDLVRADLDSVALFTEPTLAAWGIPYETFGHRGDEAAIAAAFEKAHLERRPVALLLTTSLVEGTGC